MLFCAVDSSFGAAIEISFGTRWAAPTNNAPTKFLYEPGLTHWRGLSHDGELVGAQRPHKVTAPAALLIAVVAEAHLLRLTRVSDDVQSRSEHERLLRAGVEHVW
jgi:hypothetical protein